MDFRTAYGTIRINIPNATVLAAEVSRRFGSAEGFALATLNLDHLEKLRHSPVFASAYARQDLITADGNPVVWMSRLARRPVALLPGADLIIPMARMAADAGIRVALLGTTPASLDRAAETIRRAAPGVQVTLTIAPPMGFDPEGPEAAAVLTRLDVAGIGLCFIALGAPKQEILAARGRELAPNTGFASVGAGLDFLAGSQRRAPPLLRRLALEWLWRLLSNPRRLGQRYARSAVVLPGHAWRSWRMRHIA